MFGDTPLPPEEPTGQNPLDGAILDYYLPQNAKEVSLEIWNMKQQLVRRFSSKDVLKSPDSTGLPHPTYWIRPMVQPSIKKGHQRFVWNLRYPNPVGAKQSYAIAAVQFNTPISPKGPFVAPGTFVVKLIVDGKTMERELKVRMDPRVNSSEVDIQFQTDLSMKVYNAYNKLQGIRIRAKELIRNGTLSKKKKIVINTAIGNGNPSDGDQLYGNIYRSSFEDESLVSLQEKLLFILVVLQASDERPTAATTTAVKELLKTKDLMVEYWESLMNNP